MLDRRSLVALSALGAVMVVGLAIFGYEPLARRLGTLRDTRSMAEFSNGRQALWRADAEAIRKFTLTGTGVGTHREIYPIYIASHHETEFTHAESGYLHQFVETGALGLGCMLVGIASALGASLRLLFPAAGTMSHAVRGPAL